MTVQDLIQLFEDEMINEIFHNISDDTLQDILVEAVKEVSLSNSLSKYPFIFHRY